MRRFVFFKKKKERSETYVDDGIPVLSASVLDEIWGCFYRSDIGPVGYNEFGKLGEEMRCPAVGRVHYCPGTDTTSLSRDGDPAIGIPFRNSLNGRMGLQIQVAFLEKDA